MALEVYEDALKSFIQDDDKLVTYKWLSKELEIHVNVAKDILKQYWKKHKDIEKIVATFLLIGQLKDKSIRVEIVKESNLNSARSKFLSIDCEHLYSLQKSLEDIELLASAGEGDLRYSAIKCNAEYVRNDEEIDSLRYVGNTKNEENKTFECNKVVNKFEEKQSNSLNEKSKTDIKKNVIEDIKEKERTNEKNADAKQDSKTEKKVSPTNKSNNLKSNGKLPKKPVQSKQSGFNNLFGKAASKPQTQIKPNEETNCSKDEAVSTSSEKEEIKVEQEKENRHQQSKENDKNINKSKSKIEKNSKSKNDKRGKKRNRSQEDSSSSKRKRIVVIDSSEDESERSNNEEEDDEPMEVDEEPPKIVRKRSPSPPAEKRENGKRMVRKTIDKTFKDEDGYLVTKRVHVYEVASDNDEPEEVRKEQPQKSKLVEVKAKKKQTTLTNFFKKP